MQVSDGMWRCWRNKTLADTERENTSGTEENRSSIGSVRFFKMVNQKASLGNAVTSSVEVPFKYTTVANPEIWGSAQEAQSQASIHNALAKYAWKSGKCDEKMYKFWFQIHKYCNVPVQVVWEQEKRRVAIKDPKTGKVAWKEKIVKNYPTFNVLHWSMVYADLYTADIASQQCVVVQSIVPWMEIQKGVKNRWYSKEAVAEMRLEMSKYRWDGSEGADARKEQTENMRDADYSPGESDLFLRWDTYQWAPIKGSEYDDEADYELFWSTSVGNSLRDSKALRMDKDFDPDGEIPLTIVKAIPDDSDLLYAMSWSEAVRAQYSIECTLWEEAIDNISGVNTPPLVFDSDRFKELPDDFQFGKGAKWDVDDIENAVKEFTPRDTTAQTSQLIGLIQAEESIAGNMNSNTLGEANGGRTSASESIAINRFSQQPNLAETSYILNQLIGSIAPKYKSYWQAYGDPTQIKQIADEALDAPALDEKNGYKIYGDFDVDSKVIDDFLADDVQAQQELTLLQAVSGNEALLSSKSHRVDLGQWLSGIMRRLKVQDVDLIVTPAGDSDGHLRQRDEIRSMRQTGEPIAPQEGEDHDAHIAEVNAEILRWKPIIGASLPEGTDQAIIDEQATASDLIGLLLEPHLEAHKQMKLNNQNKQNMAQTETSQEGLVDPRTSGQLAGGAIGGAIGGAAGGANNTPNPANA